MNAKHQEFVTEYIACHFNATKAYRRVYPDSSASAARANSARLIANDSVSAEIKRRIAEDGMGRDEVLSRMTEQARGAHGDYITRYGVDLDSLLADGKGHLIKSIKDTQFGKDIRFYDAQAALKLMGKHHGLFGDDTPGDDDPDSEQDWWDAAGEE